jgi:hypothetical protein
MSPPPRIPPKARRALHPMRRLANPYVIVAAAVALLCAAHAGWVGTPVFPIDDAYITLHNAQVLHGSAERNFPGTAALTGSTSVLHTLLVAVLLWIFNPLWAAMVAQYLGMLLFALAVVRLVRAMNLQDWWAYALTAVCLGAGGVVYQFLSGLETSLVLGATLFTISVAAEGKPSRLLMICCGLMPFLRPELAALSLLLVVWQVYSRLRSQDQALRKLGIDLLVCAAAALPVVALVWWNTGAVLPTTIAAKKYYFAEALLTPAVKFAWTRDSTEAFALAIGPMTAGVLFLATDALGVLLLGFVPLFLATYYLQFPGALGHYGHRYLYIMLPLVVFGICRGLNGKTKVARTMALLLVALTAAHDALSIRDSWHMYVDTCNFTRYELASVAEFCRRSLPPGSRLLIHDAGYLPYATQFETIDLVGLKTPQAVGYHKLLTYPTAGRERATAINRIALATSPQYLVVLKGWEGIFHIEEGLRRHGWTTEMVRGQFDPTARAVQNSPAYMVFRLTPPSHGEAAAMAQAQ